MSRNSRLARVFMAFLCAATALLAPAAQAKELVLHTFRGGLDGGFPDAGLIRDAQGNLYGTTEQGGDGNQISCNDGCGTVFKLAPDGRETVLHKFVAGNDGAFPLAPLVRDSAGNLYGTTQLGGTGNKGYGAIFRVSPKGKERVLYAFTGGDDGYLPQAGLIDSAGNLYGTAQNGGAAGLGTVFKLTPRGKLVTLHSFIGGFGGSIPVAGLVRGDAAGNFYGTTELGGIYCDGTVNGCGTVYKLSPEGHETVLYAFHGGSDGANPTGGLIMDAQGTLYGTTHYGGTDCYDTGHGCGTVFKLTPKGIETVLWTFQGGGSDGAYPGHGNLILDASGTLYGTTPNGGLDCNGTGNGCGVVFRLSRRGVESILHIFGSGYDGAVPDGTLMMDAAGNFYGTTFEGGSLGEGTVYEIAR